MNLLKTVDDEGIIQVGSAQLSAMSVCIATHTCIADGFAAILHQNLIAESIH